MTSNQAAERNREWRVIKCESIHGFLDSSVSCLVSTARALECLRVFWFSHHSLFSKAEVRYDVILQKVNIQSELEQHKSGMAANVSSMWIKNDCRDYLCSACSAFLSYKTGDPMSF